MFDKLGKSCWYITPANEIATMRVKGVTPNKYTLQYDDLSGSPMVLTVNPEAALFTPDEVRREIARRVAALGVMAQEFDRSLEDSPSVTGAAYAQAA